MNRTKKMLAVIVFSFLVSMAFLVSLAVNVRAENGPVEIGYLLDEDFSLLYSGSGESLPSGWDVRRAGGSLAFNVSNWFKINDTSAVLPVSMNKKFVKQSADVITLEYRFKLVTAADGVKWQLRSNETEGVSIATSATNLYMETSAGPVTLQPYTAGVEYGVKAVINITTNKTDVYINGILKAAAVNFKNAVSNLDNFHIQTGDASKGEVFFSPVKINKGYEVNEKFISVMPGTTVPGDWLANNNGGAATVEEIKSANRPDVYSLKMDATNATNGMSFTKSVAPQADKLVFEYKVLIPQKKDGLTAELKSGNVSAIKMTTSNGKLSYINAQGLPTEIYDYLPNIWYHIKVKMNWNTAKTDIYINSKLQAQGVDLASGLGSVTGIQFSTSSVNKGVMWLDDIMLYKDLPLPADYVPAPNAVNTGSYTLGAQSCPMWREGHHFGWDAINPYPERIPYLGFYDEGNPEEADWEIKWSLEHGINFQLSCWYRPQGGESGSGAPIKDPYLGAALHDGFFNAQYSDQMKFAIMWENGASRVKDSNDFRTNLIPYWIEYYFKDPRYLKVDNKPVLSIYSLSGLLRDFGTLANIKTEMDYLRGAVKAAGFDDIVLLTTYFRTDAQGQIDRKSAGFDAIYAYSWEHMSGHPELQERYMAQQRDAGVIDVLSVLSMGRDDSAWARSAGYLGTPAEFQSIAQWAKDTFIPSLPTQSLGKKLVILDHWNEYGEGHYIMPSGLAGFGFVDAIRNVFGDGSPHEDVIPSQAQKERIGVLYPSGRVMPSKSITPPAITGNYKKLWEFNTTGDSEGWSLDKQIDNLIVANGAYSGTSNGNDPGIMSPDNLGIDAADVPYIKVRMKSGLNAAGRIYFITETDLEWKEIKGESFFAKSGDGYTDYYVEMWKNSNWKGKVKRFRLDPLDGPGTFSVDSVGMVYSPIPGINMYVDGNISRFIESPVLMGNSVMLPVADVFRQVGAPVEWDPAAQTLIAVKDNSVIRIKVGDSIAYKDSQAITLEHVPVYSAKGTVLVPSNLLNQALGYSLTWDSANQILRITSKSLAWEFAASEGWTANNQVTNIQVANSAYSGTSIGTEPTLLSPDFINIDTSAVKRIRVKLKNGTSGNEAKIYYTTGVDPGWDSAKMLAAYVYPNDQTYREYVFDTTGLAEWTGILKQLKIVPTNSTGDFSIDSIILDITDQIPLKGDNLINDPGFEGSTLSYSGAKILLELSTAEAHSGHQSLKITKSDVYGSIFFPAAIQKGKEYFYSAWAKLAPGSTVGEKLRICLSYSVDGVGKQIIILTSPALSLTEWKQVQGSYIINETGNVTNVSMFMFTDLPAAADTFYLDDVEIRPVTYTESPEWVHVTDLSLNMSSVSMNVGQTVTLIAAILPSGAANKDLVWSSSNPAIAVVDVNGAVYGKNPGVAQITVTSLDSGKAVTSDVTVKEKTIETVMLTVKPDGTGDFVSPKLANDSILDSSPDRQYVILIYPGVYTEKNWVVKPYTTLRGTDRASVWLKGENSASATNNEITNQSTLWLKATANLENLTITARNMRYPVHSEDNGNNKDAVHIVKNVYVEHYGNLEAVQYRQNWVAAHPGVTPPADLDPVQVWGGISGNGSHAWGYGSASGVLETFYDSTFVSKADGWYVHNREDFTKPQINIVNSSKIVSTVQSIPIIIQSLGSGTKDEVIFNNDEFVGTFMYQNDSPWITQKPENQYANHADYTVTFNNSTPIGYADGHRGRALALFSKSTGSSSYVEVGGNAVPDILGPYITRDGGGGLKGYVYGYWDISGIKVGLSSNIQVNNTLGRRLGDCTVNNKILQVTFEDGTTKTILFNENYTEQSNSDILSKMNVALGASGNAAEYNVTANEYYPQVPDKQVTLQNHTLVGIPRFAAVTFDTDNTTLRLMTAADSAESFVGIALQPIIPGQSGRVLTEGIMGKNQLNGFTGSISTGTKISIGTQAGSLVASSNKPALLEGVQTDWAYFKGNTNWVEVTGVSLNKTSLSLALGQTETLAATVLPAGANKAVVWSSDNVNVATVDGNGNVRANGWGTTTITVTAAAGGKTATAVVTVLSPVLGDNMIADPGFEGSTIKYSGVYITRELSTSEYHSGLQSLKITKMSNFGSLYFPATIEKGKEYYYSAWIKLAPGSTTGEVMRICLQYQVDGVNKQKIILTSPALNATVWKQVQGTYTINETGNVANVQMFMFTDLPAAADAYYLDDVEIRGILSYPATGVILNKSMVSLNIGQTETLTATVVPSNATNKSVAWSTSDSAVATVDTNGTVMAVANGKATITVMTADGGFTAFAVVLVDNIPPVTTAILLPSQPDGLNGWYVSPVTVSLSASDSNSGVAATNYTVDGWAQQTGTTVAFSEDGVHTVAYWSTDKAGNIETQNTVTIQIDRTLPGNASLAADITALTNTDVTVTISYPSDAAVKEYKVGANGAWTAYGGPVVVSDNETVYARGADEAGNVSNVTSYAVSNIDHIAPVDAALAVDATSPTNQDVTVTISYPVDAAVKEYKVGASGTWTAYTAPVVVSENGTVYARGTDAAGNASNVTSIVVSNINKFAPITVATLSPAAPNGKNSWYTTDVTVSLSVTANVYGGTVTTEYQVNAGAWIIYTGSIPAFDDGTYKFGYRSKDQAGNVEQLKTVEFKVDKTAPLLAVQLDKTSLWQANHQMVAVNATLITSDATSGVASVVLTSITSNEPDSRQEDIQADFGTTATSFSLRAERLGSGSGRIYTITYTITDQAGNRSTAVSTVSVPHNQAE